MKLAEVVSLFVGPDADVELTAYDGSRYGQAGSDVRLDVRSPLAVSMLMSSPGQLGLARAYVAGELEVHGDLYTAFDRLARLGLSAPSVADQAPAVQGARAVRAAACRRRRRRRSASAASATPSGATTTPSRTTTT